MSGIDPAIAASLSPGWVAAGSAALLVIIGALVLRRSQAEAIAAARRFPLVVLGAILCGLLIWAVFAGAASRDQRAEHRALERRSQQLIVQALAPGSPLACLQTLAGDVIETACEKAVFATPANVAAATSYVAAQFALLADMTAYARSGGADIDRALNSLRKTLEADPFGFLARVLATRYECTGDNCPPLGLLRHPIRVRTNLIAQRLDQYVERYRGAWARFPGAAVGEAADAQSSAAAAANAPERRRVKLDIDFPTAASIPPISIMTPEPKPRTVPESAHKRPNTAQTDPVWIPAPAPSK